MRSRFVKRQTPPMSGFLLVSRFPGFGVVDSSVACPDLISVHRRIPMWLPYPRNEAMSPSSWQWQKSIGRCPLWHRNLCRGSSR
jgi:hypothetical protein